MNINEHPIYRGIYDLGQEIEKLPPSEQATKIVVMASALEKPAMDLIEENKHLLTQLQKECDHNWKTRDDSFSHEYGTEVLVSKECQKCGLQRPMEDDQ